jgi:hypothetical protein
MRIIETEKAYYNPTRIKHNEYMRTMQRKYNTKRKLAIDPLDLGAEEFESEIGIDMVPRQNNEHPCQNNVAIEEVPLLARIEAQAAEYEKSNQPTQNSPSESEKALKAKFGPDFHPLPARVGLKRNQT